MRSCDIETADLVRLSAHPKCVAIGEAGLDYFYDNAPKEAQETGLRRHIAAARITGLPLVIHARSADAHMAFILEDEVGQGPFPFVLHCFTAGRTWPAPPSIWAATFRSPASSPSRMPRSIRDVAKFVPADRYLVETDAPYLAPIPHRGAHQRAELRRSHRRQGGRGARHQPRATRQRDDFELFPFVFKS